MLKYCLIIFFLSAQLFVFSRVQVIPLLSLFKNISTSQIFLIFICELNYQFSIDMNYQFSVELSIELSGPSLVAQMLRLCLQCRRPGFSPWVGKIPWRREWLLSPVFLPGESFRRRSLAGHSPWAHSVRYEQLSTVQVSKLEVRPPCPSQVVLSKERSSNSFTWSCSHI